MALCLKFFFHFSPNSLLWGSLLEEKRLATICTGRVPGACPPCVRLVSAACPACVDGFGRASSPYSSLVRHLSALCPPCLVGFCPPCGRHMFALLLLYCVRLVFLALAARPVLVGTCPPGVCLYDDRLYSVWICVLCVHLCPGLFVCKFGLSGFFEAPRSDALSDIFLQTVYYGVLF